MRFIPVFFFLSLSIVHLDHAYAESQQEANPTEVLLEQAKDLIDHGKYRESIGAIDAFLADQGATLDITASLQLNSLKFAAMRSMVANGSGELRQEEIATIASQFDTVYSKFISYANELANTNKDAYLREMNHGQMFVQNYGDMLANMGYDVEAANAYRRAVEMTRPIDALLDKEMQVGTRGSGGNITKSMRTRDAYGLFDSSVYQRKCITSLESALTRNPSGEKEIVSSLLEGYNKYLSDYPQDPYCGTYCSLAMKITGEFSLDRLVETFKSIQDKNHSQYVYSSLGLCHRLISANRAKEALEYLEHIKKVGIPSDRMAELYFAFGQAHYQLGNHKDALENFLVVRKMSDNYDVGSYIKDILGTSEQDLQKIFLDVVGDLVIDASENNPTESTASRSESNANNPQAKTHQAPSTAGPESRSTVGSRPNALQYSVYALLCAAVIGSFVYFVRRPKTS